MNFMQNFLIRFALQYRCTLTLIFLTNFSGFCNRQHVEADVSTKAVCFYEGRQKKCNDYILPGTIAKISCEHGFVKPLGIEFQTELVCRKEAIWNAPKPACNMECGKITSDEITPFSVGGKTVNITKAPWHVSVYSRFEETGNLMYECGGTIISPYLVLSGKILAGFDD